VTRNVLVLGSNSFSGSNLVNRLLQSNNKVIGVSRQPEIGAPYKPYLNSDNFCFYQMDLNLDADRIVRVCAENNIDTIFNFSAQSMVGESWKYPEQWYETNIVALSVLIRNMIEKNLNLKKFIHFTTPEVYGATAEKIKENFDFAPTTPYAISRAAGDYHLLAMFKNFNFPVIFTRAANVYGEHQSNYRILPRVFINGLTSQKLNLHGGGQSKRSFIHIDDVSTALIAIMNSGEIGLTYHISTNQIVSIREIVEMCCEIMKIRIESLCIDSEERIGKDSSYRLDSDLLRESLGWRDKITLDHGLNKVYDWVNSNLGEILKHPLEYHHRK
jgi:dTDP-glucose 4,6-dehydratase